MVNVRRSVLVGLACGAAGLLLVSGCSSSSKNPTVKVGSAPPPNGVKISLPAPGVTGLAPVTAWPQSCGLLTDGDVQAILPQARSIRHQPATRVFTISPAGQAQDTEVTTRGTSCSVKFTVPGKKTGKKSRQAEIRLSVGLDAVGTPDAVMNNYVRHGRQPTPVTQSLGAPECSTDRTGYACRTARVAFYVNWSDPSGVAKFAGQKGKGTGAVNAFFHDRVAPEFVKAVAQKLP
jgi:hypothetical protein